MTKRGIIQLNGSNPIFRISRIGVDVDFAQENDFLVHETRIIAQPFFFRFVPCPFAGYTGGELRDATVTVSDIPAGVTNSPEFIMYPVHAGGRRVWPWALDATRVGAGYGINYRIHLSVVSATQVQLRFIKQPSSRTSPDGCNLVVYRQAN